jgi:hypothetical protein
MKEIIANLFIGDEDDCRLIHGQEDWAIIHACKFPCHREALGYKYKLPQSHPNYLIYKSGFSLYLNMVDMEQELHPIFTNPIMESSIEFIEEHIDTKKILIHCNQGLSRSPSIGLVYLVRKGHIKQDDFNKATFDFIKLYPNYSPGKGINLYLYKNWNYLINSH